MFAGNGSGGKNRARPEDGQLSTGRRLRWL